MESLGAHMQGRLSKWTNYVSGWQFRWFILQHGTLTYYSSKDQQLVPKGSLNVAHADISIDAMDETSFTITEGSKTFYLKACSSEERQLWINSLHSAKLLVESSQPSSESSLVPRNWQPLKNRSTQLHNKYVEAHMLRNLAKQHLDTICSHLETSFPKTPRPLSEASTDGNEDFCCERNRVSRSLSIDSEYTIKDENLIFKATSDALFKTLDDCLHSIKLAIDLSSSTAVQSQVFEKRKVSAEISEDPGFALSKESFHSVGGTDIFFDAMEDADCLSNKSSEVEMNCEELSDADSEPPSDDEGDTGQRSVLYHLLSQVKIGMDLTKIVLPTFILEKKSLLEMYSDFMAHADLFLSIPDGSNSLQRFISMLRWYLTSFAEGRKSSIAKKPYNPILGENFSSSWVVDPDSGPISFVAEQVSHHPPISAFYFENKQKGIVLNAHIWTKSKFLGMSVGVHNVGQASIELLNHSEEYIVTFPNAYARSIFTVPWVELCGKTSIVCKNTGYRADIDFISKPMFGGKPNRISCEVRHINSPKPIYRVHGEWNGIICFRNMETGEDDFIDTQTLPIIQKIVKPLNDQNDMESRKLWKHVTRALRYRDIQTATMEKKKLEDHQRADAKYRLDHHITYTPKLFYQDHNENWRYRQSLI